ncbi:MAG TPA: N-acetylmuramoyl-L-alanine amidase [Gemmatimonadales bacterium]
MHPDRCAALVGIALLTAGCASRSTPAPPLALPPADTVTSPAPPARSLPPVPEVRGPLALRVVYPPADAAVRAGDSSFLFGSVGTGGARLAVNGTPVRVWPNGAWLAWVPFPQDSVVQLRIEATTDTESVSLLHRVRRAGWRPPPPPGLWIDTTSLVPRGPVWWPKEEYLTLRARAAEGAQLRLLLPDGAVVPLAPVAAREEVEASVRAFDRDTANLATPAARDRYAGVIRGRPLGPDPGPLFPVAAPVPLASSGPSRCVSTGGCGSGAVTAPADSQWAVLEAVLGTDTVRSRWPLQLALLDTLPLLAELDDDTTGLGATDGLVVGRALPGGTYHWFFATGTRAPVSGRIGRDLRLRLAPGIESWVAHAEARPAGGAPAEPAVAGSLTLTPREDRVSVRVPLDRRVPLRVSETEHTLVLRLYGSVGDVNWIRYGAGDSLVRQVSWAQAEDEQVTLTFELSRPVWGYRVRWERNDLIFEIRRPPELDKGHPLRNRLIAVDPGHPPAGATGPTGLREAEANLLVALEVRRLLEEAGARVLMTRTADVPLDLWPRIRMAESAGADVLVSVHNNALPDGVNPYTNNGTSVYYNHPRSVPLARAVQEELVQHLGLRDLGFGRGDLAMVRATWMPAVLTEGLFMMVPEQEAALRTPDGRRRYASAIFHGLRRFLRDRAREE